jgi:hypothetical protein
MSRRGAAAARPRIIAATSRGESTGISHCWRPDTSRSTGPRQMRNRAPGNGQNRASPQANWPS